MKIKLQPKSTERYVTWWQCWWCNNRHWKISGSGWILHWNFIQITTTKTTILQLFVWDYGLSWYQKKHSHTHTYPDHQTSFISLLNLLRSIAYALFNLRACADSLFAQSLSEFTLVYLLVWNPLDHFILHTLLHLIIVFFMQHMHAHNIATCFAVVVPRLCHLFLVSLSTLYLILHLLP